MKILKVTLAIFDLDDIGEERICTILEEARYPNHCISVSVVSSNVVEVSDWDDNHPLNKSETFEEEFNRIFPKK